MSACRYVHHLNKIIHVRCLSVSIT